MAYILYKKIKASRNSRKTQDFTQQLSDDGQSPIHLKDISHTTATTTPPISASKEEQQALIRYRRKLLLGLCLPFTVQAFDLTVIAPATPFIAADFNEFSQLNWIVSSFNICNAAFIPIWAQLADTFGRYAALQTATLIALLGTTLCAAVPVTAFPVLCLGRGLQGAGCASLLIITKVILADKVSLKENARNNSTFAFFAAIGYGFGPVIGGYLTETSWRYCFVLVIPISVVGMLATHFLLRNELVGAQNITRNDGNETVETSQTLKAKLSTIDFGGQVFFLLGAGLFVLALTWAGSSYAWSSLQVILPLVLAIVLLISFFIWEYLLAPTRYLAKHFPTQKPMLPLHLLASRNCGLLMYINFTTGMAMYAVFYFSSLYLTLVAGLGPGSAGKNLAYYVPGLGVGAIMAMFACNIWPLRTWFPLFLGTMLEPLGITLLAVAMNMEKSPFIYGMLGLTGVGTGIRLMPGTLHGVGYHCDRISSIVSLMSLAQAFGGTIATTVMLNIFNQYISSRGVSLKNTGSMSVIDSIKEMTSEQKMVLRTTAKGGIVLAFLAITAFLWLGLGAMFGMGNVKIAKKEGEEDEIIKGSYVGSWLVKKHGMSPQA